MNEKFLKNLYKSRKYQSLLTPIKSHQIRVIHGKMELNHKYTHRKLLFIQLLNDIHQSIDSHLALDFWVNLTPFWRVLLHINGNVSLSIHFWIFAYGGNEHPYTFVSLPAEVWVPAILGVEQDQKFHFAKIAAFGMFCSLFISFCKNDNIISKKKKWHFFLFRT